MYGRELALRAPSPVFRFLIGRLGTYDLGARVRFAAVEGALRRIPPPSHVLDVGSGLGLLAFAMLRMWPSASLVGIDIDRSRNAEATGLARSATLSDRSTFIHPDDRPAEARYDLVTCVDVLEHVEDDTAFVNLMYTATAPGGTCIIHVPASTKRRFLREFPEQADHVRPGYDVAGLKALLERAGFDTVQVRPTFGAAGALAWEGFALARGGSAAARVLLPVWYLLAAIDTLHVPKRGNGVLAFARRSVTSS